MEKMNEIRLKLIEYSTTHTLDELMTRALDEIGSLVDSPIGFYHFVEADQKTISLQQWSTRTLLEFCRTEGKGRHYPIEQAGIWADCARQKKPVIHNDYLGMKYKQGMPEGHAEVIRELAAPVMREGKVVAILGVGNKPVDYTEKDMEIVAFLSDITWEIVRSKRAEDALIESEKRYRRLFESAKDGILILDADTGQVVDVNPFLSRLLGYSHSAFLGKHLWEIGPFKDIDSSKKVFKALLDNEYIRYEDLPLETADGHIVDVEFVSNVYLVDQRKVIQCNIRDITERRKLEARFQQAQKMESVGRLAGGVAHDYNNMLSVIIGYTELAMDKVNPSLPLYADLKEILDAAGRSAEITRQLLAFARKQVISPRVLAVNEIVEAMSKMLRHLIGEDIDLVWQPGADLWPVKMDPSQIDQILANLCVNARDAIAGVGKLTMETHNVTFDEAYCADHAGFIPGEFVLLAVSDDGCGMDKEILDNIFEPFFTTKDVSHGTGLGLATVFGIVKQNNGFINVYSEPGTGTTFRVYLPSHGGETEEIPTTNIAETPWGLSERILLVEDEPAIRKMCRMMLERLGYQVLTAGDSSEAVRLAEEHAGTINLLITDVVMPDMNGHDLADQLQSCYPEIKTLFMSGYTAEVIAHRGVLEEGMNFIQKPFSMKDLGIKVRAVIDTQ